MVQAHAKEVGFTSFKEAFGWLEEQVVFSEDLEEFEYDLLV